MKECTRKDLISLCEKAIVNERKWQDRDSHSAQKNIGECWALLKAGCKYEIIRMGPLMTDMETIWIKITSHGFSNFDCNGPLEKETYYIPTQKRLDEANGNDWY